MLVCMRIAVARFMCVIFVCEIFESIDFAYVLTLKGGRNAATQVLVENKTDSPSKVLIFLRPIFKVSKCRTIHKKRKERYHIHSVFKPLGSKGHLKYNSR